MAADLLILNSTSRGETRIAWHSGRNRVVMPTYQLRASPTQFPHPWIMALMSTSNRFCEGYLTSSAWHRCVLFTQYLLVTSLDQVFALLHTNLCLRYMICVYYIHRLPDSWASNWIRPMANVAGNERTWREVAVCSEPPISPPTTHIPHSPFGQQ